MRRVITGGGNGSEQETGNQGAMEDVASAQVSYSFAQTSYSSERKASNVGAVEGTAFAMAASHRYRMGIGMAGVPVPELGHLRGSGIRRPGFSACRSVRVVLGSRRPKKAKSLPGLRTNQFGPGVDR
jgi:hypothetical protein